MLDEWIKKGGIEKLEDKENMEEKRQDETLCACLSLSWSQTKEELAPKSILAQVEELKKLPTTTTLCGHHLALLF